MSEEGKTFEARLEEVERMVQGIESGKLPLEEAVKQYEQGIRILDGLEKEINEMKRRITQIRENGEGEPAEEPYGEDK